HDVRVAIADEGEDWPARAVRLDAGCEPHLTGAALHLVGVGARALGQRRQLAAELDHIAVAVVPVVEDGEIVDDVVDIHALRLRPRYRRRPRRGRGHYERTELTPDAARRDCGAAADRATAAPGRRG